ncbi:MAG TPA: glycosyltransferase [Azospirillum sp.]|nr:glycosyltransferase [Azospirillum sp.]
MSTILPKPGALLARSPLAAVLVAFLLLLLPSAFNGAPILFFDTRGYYNAGKAVFRELAELPVVGNLIALAEADRPQAAAPAPAAQPQAEQQRDEIIFARSPYYGVMIYALGSVGSPWLPAIAQLAVVTYMIWLLSSIIDDVRRRALFIAGAGAILLATPAPLFASYMMPDVFAGVTALAVLVPFLLRDRLSRRDRAAVFAILVFSLVAHTTHLLLAAVSLAAMLAYGWLRVTFREALRRCAFLGGAIAAALGLHAVFVAGAILAYGMVPSNPPFLLARMLDDGSALRWLREECADGRRFVLCRYLNRFPMDNDVFLWARDARGVFYAVPPQVRDRIIEEQGEIIGSTLAEYPEMQLAASLGNFASQVLTFHMNEFSTAERLHRLVPRYAPDWADDFSETLLARGEFPLRALSLVVYVSVAASLVGSGMVLFALASGDRRPNAGHARRTATAVVFVLGFIVANAAICGILSGPHARYQARVVWILPLIAWLALFVHWDSVAAVWRGWQRPWAPPGRPQAAGAPRVRAAALPEAPAATRVAVCIVSYNRPEGVRALLAALEHLAFAAIPPAVTVAVVDNAPDRPLEPMIAALRDRYRWPLLYGWEPVQGVSAARNRALRLAPADSDFVAFIDDDETPEPQWLDELIAVSRRFDAAMVMGTVRPAFEGPPSAWMVERRFFQVGPRADGSATRWVSSGNCLFRLDMVRALGLSFDMRFNRRGGEDEDFFGRAIRAGYRSVTASRAVTWERIPDRRMTLGWLLRRHFRMGNTLALIDRYRRPAPVRAVRAVKGFGRIALGTLQLLGSPLTGRAAAVSGLCNVCWGAGALVGLVNPSHDGSVAG